MQATSNRLKKPPKEGQRRLQKHTLGYVPGVILNETRIWHLERIRKSTSLRLRLAGWEGVREGAAVSIGEGSVQAAKPTDGGGYEKMRLDTPHDCVQNCHC